MLLKTFSDASYLNRPKSGLTIGGLHTLSDHDPANLYRTHSIDLHACYTVLHCTIVSCTPSVPVDSALHELIVDLHTC